MASVTQSLGWLPAAVPWLLAALLTMLALAMRRRLERARRAEHEIRGPLAALVLGVEQVRRGRAGSELAGTLEAQLDRARAGVGDLTAALAGPSIARRAGGGGSGSTRRQAVSLERLARHTAAGWEGVAARAGRRVRFHWSAGPATVAADRGRLAQALGNLISNAIEHGGGEVELRGRRVGRAVRVEVVDAGGAARPPLAMAPLERDGMSAPQPRRRGRGLEIAGRAAQESGGRLELVQGATGTTAALELPIEER